MKSITVAELRQNPTPALNEVAEGESLVITKHRRPVAKLVPVDADTLVRVVPPKNSGPSNLAGRNGAVHSYDDTEALLGELTSEW